MTNSKAAANISVKKMNRKQMLQTITQFNLLVVQRIKEDDDVVVTVHDTDLTPKNAIKALFTDFGVALLERDLDKVLACHTAIMEAIDLLHKEKLITAANLKIIRGVMSDVLSDNLIEKEIEEEIPMQTKTTTVKKDRSDPLHAAKTSAPAEVEVVKATPAPKVKSEKVKPKVEDAPTPVEVEAVVPKVAKPATPKKTVTKATTPKVETADTVPLETAEQIIDKAAPQLRAVGIDIKDVKDKAAKKVKASHVDDDIAKADAKIIAADEELRAIKEAKKKLKKIAESANKQKAKAEESEVKALKKAAKKLGLQLVDEDSKKVKTSKKKSKSDDNDDNLSTYEKCRRAGLNAGSDIFNAAKILTLDTARVLVGKKTSYDNSKPQSKSSKIIESVNKKNAAKVFYI